MQGNLDGISFSVTSSVKIGSVEAVLCLRTQINFCRYFPRLFGVNEVPYRKEICTSVKVCECRENGAGKAVLFLLPLIKLPLRVYRKAV